MVKCSKVATLIIGALNVLTPKNVWCSCFEATVAVLYQLVITGRLVEKLPIDGFLPKKEVQNKRVKRVKHGIVKTRRVKKRRVETEWKSGRRYEYVFGELDC